MNSHIHTSFAHMLAHPHKPEVELLRQRVPRVYFWHMLPSGPLWGGINLHSHQQHEKVPVSHRRQVLLSSFHREGNQGSEIQIQNCVTTEPKLFMNHLGNKLQNREAHEVEEGRDWWKGRDEWVTKACRERDSHGATSSPCGYFRNCTWRYRQIVFTTMAIN